MSSLDSNGVADLRARLIADVPVGLIAIYKGGGT